MTALRCSGVKMSVIGRTPRPGSAPPRSERQRAQELRQSSPLVTILPQEARNLVLDQIAALKKGVILGEGTSSPGVPFR